MQRTHPLVYMTGIGLVLNKATLPLLVRPKHEIEEASLLAGLPVPSFSVCRLLNLVIGIHDLDRGGDVLLVLLAFPGACRVLDALNTVYAGETPVRLPSSHIRIYICRHG
jgi:hypothetical protein